MNKNTTNFQKQIDIIHQNTVVLFKYPVLIDMVNEMLTEDMDMGGWDAD